MCNVRCDADSCAFNALCPDACMLQVLVKNDEMMVYLLTCQSDNEGWVPLGVLPQVCIFGHLYSCVCPRECT